MLLITDDKNLAKELPQKLIFLRHDDGVTVSAYENAVQNAKLSESSIILLHENQVLENTVNLLKELKNQGNFCIILLANSYNKELILSAYDCGVDDFAVVTAPDYEFVTRIVTNMRHNSAKSVELRSVQLLKQLSVIDELTDLYSYKFSKRVIENVMDTDLVKNGSFMAIAPYDKTKFIIENMACALKKSVRANDIVTLGKGANFYIFLADTDLNGALTVLNKIKENYGHDVCAGICEIRNKKFEEFESEALKALSEASTLNAEYVFAETKEETLDEWLDDEKNYTKGYKIFRQMFNKKLEKVIGPVFFRLQKTYEEKLFETEIEQNITNDECVLHLKNKDNESTLRIVYPGFAKIIITITHAGLDSPENKEIQLPLAKITKNELIQIAEDFIKEFKLSNR